MAIKVFNDFYGEASLTLVANELGVTPATAHKVIEHLENEHYVVKLSRGIYSLTSNGDEIASKMLAKHRILEVFLGILGFNILEVHVHAHELEHVNDVVIDRIYNMLGRPMTCPHGNPIIGKPEGMRLSKSYPGNVIITSVAESKNVLNFLIQHKLSINDRLAVVRRRKGNVTIEVNGKRIIVDESIASGIIVTEVK
ncbi:metal-dependent transcriptional regulator [Caldivirga maquilingensis]|uniref:Iron dependent repressor n=1 Tax=Caldivirga maquilingensis (strain ATCC 700844 / DSM 13496 / JCM 10307 / IC-167) TaxID=397948 RepID=A8MAJ8_CALMQ|nr:metal-dependent transcriptional regulator [Caldivirga maquilingensis]ABW02575.1 iron dependent repressor [Caldivirga maquilingensis IC-167]